MMRCVTLAVACFVSHSFRERKEGAGENSSGLSSQSLALWDAYVLRTAQDHDAISGLQPGCVPQLHKSTSRRNVGTIMLIHGFTACPQQFENLIPLLTSKGYDVLLPLTPGHGYEPEINSKGEVKDYLGAMPLKKGLYDKYVKEMHDVMQATTKEKVLCGMSLGGAIASKIGSLGGYDRQLLAVPMVRAAGMLDQIMTFARLNPFMNRKRQSWGPGCEVERNAGRAGICQFTAEIGATARNFGTSTVTKAQHSAQEGTVAVIYVEDDQAVNTVAVQNLALKYGIGHDSKYICGMDKVVGHSFLSPYDNPTEDKFWLTEVTQKVAKFLTSGVALQQDGMIGTWPRCELRSLK